MLTEQNLNEIEVQRGDVRIRIRRESDVGRPASNVPERSPDSDQIPEAVEAAGSKEASRWLTVTSPMVGTFYRSSSPDVAAYVEEGDVVSRGQVLCIVEAMKLMNEIESEVEGRIVKVLVENEAVVEYGQPLFVIDPLPVP